MTDHVVIQVESTQRFKILIFKSRQIFEIFESYFNQKFPAIR